MSNKKWPTVKPAEEDTSQAQTITRKNIPTYVAKMGGGLGMLAEITRKGVPVAKAPVAPTSEGVGKAETKNEKSRAEIEREQKEYAAEWQGKQKTLLTMLPSAATDARSKLKKTGKSVESSSNGAFPSDAPTKTTSGVTIHPTSSITKSVPSSPVTKDVQSGSNKINGSSLKKSTSAKTNTVSINQKSSGEVAKQTETSKNSVNKSAEKASTKEIPQTSMAVEATIEKMDNHKEEKQTKSVVVAESALETIPVNPQAEVPPAQVVERKEEVTTNLEEKEELVVPPECAAVAVDTVSTSKSEPEPAKEEVTQEIERLTIEESIHAVSVQVEDPVVVKNEVVIEQTEPPNDIALEAESDTPSKKSKKKKKQKSEEEPISVTTAVEVAESASKQEPAEAPSGESDQQQESESLKSSRKKKRHRDTSNVEEATPAEPVGVEAPAEETASRKKKKNREASNIVVAEEVTVELQAEENTPSKKKKHRRGESEGFNSLTQATTDESKPKRKKEHSNEPSADTSITVESTPEAEKSKKSKKSKSSRTLQTEPDAASPDSLASTAKSDTVDVETVVAEEPTRASRKKKSSRALSDLSVDAPPKASKKSSRKDLKDSGKQKSASNVIKDVILEEKTENEDNKSKKKHKKDKSRTDEGVAAVVETETAVDVSTSSKSKKKKKHDREASEVVAAAILVEAEPIVQLAESKEIAPNETPVEKSQQEEKLLPPPEEVAVVVVPSESVVVEEQLEVVMEASATIQIVEILESSSEAPATVATNGNSVAEVLVDGSNKVEVLMVEQSTQTKAIEILVCEEAPSTVVSFAAIEQQEKLEISKLDAQIIQQTERATSTSATTTPATDSAGIPKSARQSKAKILPRSQSIAPAKSPRMVGPDPAAITSQTTDSISSRSNTTLSTTQGNIPSLDRLLAIETSHRSSADGIAREERAPAQQVDFRSVLRNKRTKISPTMMAIEGTV